MTRLFAIGAAILYAAHQDWWFWSDRTLVLGFLPVGLAYHAAYTLVVFAFLGAWVVCAWPTEAEEGDAATDRPGGVTVP